MKKNGELFVFEGVDAVGKSSLSDLLANWFSVQGRVVDHRSFPGKLKGTIGELVYRIHHYPETLELEHLTASSLQALHIAAHIDAIQTKIIPSLKSGKTVILDRYWWSTRVYGLAEGVDSLILDKLIEAELVAWEDWQPTALFYITRDTPLRDEPMAKWHKLRNEYEILLSKDSGQYPIHIIQNERSINDCFSAILGYCSTHT